MARNQKKFLDYDGLVTVLEKFQDYPDNEILGTVINAIDEVKANVDDIPTKTSDLTNDSGFITSYTETDPTVPAWAKAATKPSYSYNEISNRPIDLGDLTNNAGYLTSYTETDPVFSASAASRITSANITSWNNKSEFSGAYNDLTGKPDIPAVSGTYSSTSTDAMSGVAVNSAITSALGNINSFDVSVISELPATGNAHTIYFVPQAVNSSTHDEYMYINNAWELIGNTSVDLSGYLQTSDIADWAKAASKPSYTASEVGALSNEVKEPLIVHAEFSDVAFSLIDSTGEEMHEAFKNDRQVIVITIDNENGDGDRRVFFAYGFYKYNSYNYLCFRSTFPEKT